VYQALDDETKAQVDQEMIVEENEVLEQERGAILADWRRYYPNQFSDDGWPLVNPLTPIEVDSPPNSPASPVFPSPKLRPAARMKSLLDLVVKRPRSSSTGSPLVQPLGPSVSQDVCSLVHPPASDSEAQSFTHNSWGPGIPYRVPCSTPCGFGEGSYI